MFYRYSSILFYFHIKCILGLPFLGRMHALYGLKYSAHNQYLWILLLINNKKVK